jgi:hypothetical protein
MCRGLERKTGRLEDLLVLTKATADGLDRGGNETLSLVIAYGSEGRDGSALALSLRVVIAHRPNRVIRVKVREVQGPTDLLMLLREVQEEYCERVRGRNGQGRASSSEST